ncbi:MAG TPA: DUF1802 family protein [Gemmataceae bacterium]|nr:DUF1802 family protein [Gemmataceae bacterium]
MSGLRHAFKEWAVVCKALADGRQSIVLRKGGIAEKTAEFQVEHKRFWLYPTYVHQQGDGVSADALPLLEQAEAERPPIGVVRLTHFAEAAWGVYRLHNLPAALLLGGMHCLSAATVQARFEYRRPGLYVVPVRVYRALQAVDLAETAYCAGCRSWVELERELQTDGAAPVLSEEAFREMRDRLERLLQPTATA